MSVFYITSSFPCTVPRWCADRYVSCFKEEKRWKYCVHMCVNGKMRLVETNPGTGVGGKGK
jgi:hypothetical protein